MGMCDPKAIRNGRSWADLVNQPGFITQAMKDHHARTHGHLPGKVAGTAPNPATERDNTLSKNKPKE